MTNAMTDSKDDTSSPSISADDIIIWLRANPDFLHEYPEACDLLTPPKEHSGKGVIDFQQFMVKRLREDRDGIIEEAREIVETSRANMSNQARIHNAVLMILEARTFEDFIHTIVMDCASLLDVDIISLVIEAEGSVIPHINIAGVHIITPGSIELLMKDQHIILESHIKGIGEIYGGGAGLVKSQALVRLNIARGTPPALIAFGSRDPDMFQPGQATDLILFFTRVIERSFFAWLDLQ
ncbi:MAG: DUF484 family protein [Rhodospirillales bacterium]|nr:DUF484 family protein [Rhodospirillales bacterium]